MTTSAVDEPTPVRPALAIRGLSVSFRTDAGVVGAVRDVSFSVDPGEVVAVVGESGSGKSVSSRAAIGLLPETAMVHGSVRLGDREVTTMSAKELTAIRGKDIAMVFQEPGAVLDPLFTVGSQLAEAITAHPPVGTRITRKQARARAVELLTMVRLPDPDKRVGYYPHELSGGQKQRVVIAMAIACDPKVIIADEPTTALDVTVQAEILDLLRDLKDRLGTAIVLITHNMGVVADMADRVVVMNEGRVVEQARVSELFATPEDDYTRTLLAAVPHLGTHSSTTPAVADDAEVVLEVSHLSVEFPTGLGGGVFRAVDDVSFSIARGQTLGLVGESGSGKSTIGRCVAGLQRPTRGRVTVLGTDIAGLSGRKMKPIRRRFGFVFQDPATSLNPRMTVGQCVAEPLVVHGFGDAAAIAARVRELLDSVRLPSGSEKRYPHELSGGQRQRANLARALGLGPDLIVADEPTSALDVSVQASVLDLFADLQQQWDFGALFISHDLAVVEQVAQRVAVLNNGAVIELDTSEKILRAPTADYTKALLAAVPVPDPTEQRRRREQGRSTAEGSGSV